MSRDEGAKLLLISISKPAVSHSNVLCTTSNDIMRPALISMDLFGQENRGGTHTQGCDVPAVAGQSTYNCAARQDRPVVTPSLSTALAVHTERRTSSTSGSLAFGGGPVGASGPTCSTGFPPYCIGMIFCQRSAQLTEPQHDRTHTRN